MVGGAGSLVLEERFSIVPEWVLDAAVSDAAVRLYAVLLRFGATSGQRMPSRRTLADRLRKRSVDSVDRALKELVAIGAVEVTRRSRDGLNLTNRYLVRSTRPGRSRPQPGPGGGGRTDTATPGTGEPPAALPTTGGTPVAECRRLGGGRRSAARVAATVRPYRESSTESSPPPPRPSSVKFSSGVTSEHDGTASVIARRALRRGQVLAVLGLEDLEDVAARCARLRAECGLSAGLWTADRLADVLASAVLDADWPAAAAVPALLAVASDPSTRSPARLSCPGPWWDAPTGAAGGDAAPESQDKAQEEDPIADLEAVLVETGGLRVALQRQARAELSVDRVPLTRSSVTRRAVEIMRRAGDGAASAERLASLADSLSAPPVEASVVGVSGARR